MYIRPLFKLRLLGLFSSEADAKVHKIIRILNPIFIKTLIHKFFENEF